MTKINSSMHSIGELTIHTLSAGTAGNQPVLLLHGKAFQAQTWNDLGTLQLLADNGCNSVALDLPGWGHSPEAEFSAEDVVKGTIEQLQLDPPIIIGPSMGGRIGLEFALSHPQLVSGLVLIGAVGVKENRSRLSELPEQTLIVWGENDQISDPANGQLLNREIIGSQLAVIPATKHACYTEKPQEFHQILINFIGNA